MPIPPDFEANCLYTPDAWFINDVRFEVDQQRVVGSCDTTKLGVLVDAQREWPGHDKHFPGAIAIQITGTLVQLHSAYLLDMPATEGWVGFGTHVHSARFRRMGVIGPPVECSCTLLSKRTLRGTVFTRYAFNYTQHGEEIFRSEQTAAWVQSDHRGLLPEPKARKRDRLRQRLVPLIDRLLQ